MRSRGRDLIRKLRSASGLLELALLYSQNCVLYGSPIANISGKFRLKSACRAIALVLSVGLRCLK